MLTESLTFPSVYKCEKYIKSIPNNIPVYYLDESCIFNIIKNWKSKNNIKSNTIIQCCLSVDALFFNPEITISPDNEISGMNLKISDVQKLPEKVSYIFSENPELFESFLRYHKKEINRASFVFQIQPFNIIYPCFVCHIFPFTTGKANSEIIEKLNLIKKIAKQLKIYIKTYAFDGDNCYNKLHNQYYGTFINYLMNKLNLKLNKKCKVMRVVCDPPHLLKRLRYRLFSNFIYSGFEECSDCLIDIEQIRAILDFIPNIVFDNNKLTKMNDRLTLLLFSSRSFIKLLESQYFAAIAYWFPAVCFIIAMTDEELSYQWQLFFLECTLWFLVFYKEAEIKSKPIKPLKYRKSGENNNVRFYTEEFLIQFTNSTYCDIQLMMLYEHYFCFNRNSSTPLEHTFGRGRVRSKDINTLSRFVKSISDIENYSKSCNELMCLKWMMI